MPACEALAVATSTHPQINMKPYVLGIPYKVRLLWFFVLRLYVDVEGSFS